MKYLDIAIANEQISQVKIKGKNYSEVNQRIKAFRMVYPTGTIKTDLISNENGVCVFRAFVTDDEGKLLATGTAYEKEESSFINQTSYIENCETSAVGRALGIAGFGIDISVRSAEEMQNAINNQIITKEIADTYKLNMGKYKGKTFKEVLEIDKEYIDWIINNTQSEEILKIIELSTGIKIPSQEELKEKCELLIKVNNMELDHDEIHKKYNVNDIGELTIEQLKEVANG